MQDRTLFRMGSWAAILGGVIALVGNILHPRLDSFDDPIAEEFRVIAETDSWVGIHVGILVGFLLITFGLYALARSMKGGPAEGIARIALGSLLISTPIGITALLVDGYALGAASDALIADPSLTALATATGEMAWAGFMGLVITGLGITPAIFAIAVARDGGYPAWLGWGAFIFALGSIGSGIAGVFGGPSSGFFLVFSITSGVLTLWVIAVGALLGRRASGAITVPESSRQRSAIRG